MYPESMNDVSAAVVQRPTPRLVPVRGKDKDGNVVWWTGKAGNDFVSTDRADAFVGYIFEGAQRKADCLNRATRFHGYHFAAFDEHPRPAAFARWANEKCGAPLPRSEVLRILRGCRYKGWPYHVQRTGAHRFRVSHGGSVSLMIATDGTQI